jgi:hypothetical protein
VTIIFESISGDNIRFFWRCFSLHVQVALKTNKVDTKDVNYLNEESMQDVNKLNELNQQGNARSVQIVEVDRSIIFKFEL